MGLYTRQQLVLLLLLVGAAGAGLAVSHWRAAHPELAERLEQIDREISPVAETPVQRETSSPAERLTAATPTKQRDAERPARTTSPPRTTSPSRPAKRSAEPDDEHFVPLDLNRATVGELVQLPGVGPVLARRIVAARDEAGRFTTVDDLAAIRGLGRSKFERLRHLVGVVE